MPLKNINQPPIIKIDTNLRLIVLDKSDWIVALKWYHNPKILYYSEGITDEKTYDIDTINRMYEYLSNIGELYFIEINENDKWILIGDVTLSEKNMPIIIGDEYYWGKGIGYIVINTLINRAKVIGITQINIPTIYSYNKRSQNLFKSIGFIELNTSNLNKSYVLNII